MSILKKLRECSEPLNVKEVAELLCVSEATIQRWVRGREVPALRIGDTIRFDPGLLADWIEQRSIATESRMRELVRWRMPMPKKKKQPKNKPPAFQFYAKDWTASPTRQMMSLAAQGAYINLLAIAWDSDPIATIPNQPDKLWKLATAMPEEWKVIRDEVLENFEPFDENPTRLVNKRLRRQWLELQEFTEMATERGRKGAGARWDTEGQEPGQAEEEDQTHDENPTDEGADINEDAV